MNRTKTSMQRFALLTVLCFGLSQAFVVPRGCTRRPLRLTNDLQNDQQQQQLSEEKGLLSYLDEAGLNLKPKAIQMESKAQLATKNSQKIRYTLQSCVLFTLFMLYRAYRGFFVILPAVFRETFRKLEAVVDERPFDDNQVVDESQDSKRLRTRVTISVLAVIVTSSYVLGGALRVLAKLIRNSGGPISSFEAAAEEQERNEDALLSRNRDINGQP